MLQTLLEDRFKLKIRRTVRKVPAYALTVAKGGPKLHLFKCTPLDPKFLAVSAAAVFRPAAGPGILRRHRPGGPQTVGIGLRHNEGTNRDLLCAGVEHQ
jgi:hypothetical protein